MSKKQVIGMMSEWSGIIRDMFRQIDDGSITLGQTKAFVAHQNPFAVSDICQGVIGMMSEWSGVIRDMFRQFNDGSLTLEHAKAFAAHQNPFAITDIRQEWQEFYRKYFRLSVDFSKVAIPADQGDLTRIIFVCKGLTLRQVIKVMEKYFPVSFETSDLIRNVNDNIRQADRNYAIRVGKCVELTLLELLVHELKYFSETNQHLSFPDASFCNGSGNSDGDVPLVRWDNSNFGKLCIRWARVLR